MKQVILSIILSVSATFTFAQAVPDASFTDCNGSTRSIYQALATGKVLVVANAGTNCGICQSHAPGVASLANNNPNSMEVWGSITTKTGGNPGCTALNSWVNTYSWTNVFSFLDSNKYWFVAATPRYTVIDPADSSIAYAGSNWTTAQNTATQLANSIGIDEQKLVSSVAVANNALHIRLNETAKSGNVKMYDITGALLEDWNIIDAEKNMTLRFNRTYKKGIYLIQIAINGKEDVKKILL